MVGKKLDRTSKVFLGALAIGLILFGYTLLAAHQHRVNPSDTTIPTWSQLANGVMSIVCISADDQRRWEDAKEFSPNIRYPKTWLTKDAEATGKRFFLGVVFAVVVAIVLGILMACSQIAEAFFLPSIIFMAKIAPTAALPVFFALIHSDTETYTAMIVFGIAPVMAQTIYLAAHEIPDEFFQKALTLGASGWVTVRHVIFPFILPKAIDAVRLALGPAIVYLVAAEALFSDNGFGYTIRMQARLLNMSVVYPYLIVLAGFTSLMDYSLRMLQRSICRWYAREAEE
jgi:NitT/TauT family transport system permease protein